MVSDQFKKAEEQTHGPLDKDRVYICDECELDSNGFITFGLKKMFKKKPNENGKIEVNFEEDRIDF